MHVGVHHLIKRFDGLDPVVLNGVRQAAEDVVPILHSARENLIDLFVLSVVIDEIEHVHGAARLPEPLDAPQATLVATPADFLVDGKKPRKLTGVTQEQMAKMEREMANLQGQYKMVEQTYGQDVLNLVLARGYLAKLLENKQVVRYLKQRQSEVLAEFETIVQTVSLEQ